MTSKKVTPIVLELMKERLNQKMTKMKAGIRAGYHFNQISYWERGIHQPNARALTDYAQALGKRLKLEDIPGGENQLELMEE